MRIRIDRTKVKVLKHHRTVARLTSDILRMVIKRQTCASVQSSASLSRTAGSSAGECPPKSFSLTQLTMSSSRRTEIRYRLAPTRSRFSPMAPTYQPWFSSPSKHDAGMRTFSKKVSLVRAMP